MGDLTPAARAPLLALGFAALVAGTLGGLVRLGVSLPAPVSGIAWHGVLMASGFFGTLIALERAVAIKQLWAYAAPAANGAGAVLLLAGEVRAGFALFLVGAAIFVLASVSIWWRQRVLHTAILALGATGLFIANLALALGRPLAAVAPCWIAFFALTIGGERLELTRLVPVPPAARVVFAGVSVALLGAALYAVCIAGTPVRILGWLLLASAGWLMRYDIATRTVRTAGLTRFIALCLLAGYVWLAMGGAILAATGGTGSSGEAWDAALHAILVGFVFSMVFGHAPVILPAVLRIAFPYHAALYLPLALLHASLALRIAGDFTASMTLRAAGGAGNAAAIALFIASAATLVIYGAVQRGHGAARLH